VIQTTGTNPGERGEGCLPISKVQALNPSTFNDFASPACKNRSTLIDFASPPF